jgi:hypothetical protein
MTVFASWAAVPRLISRNGHDFSERFPFINLAIGALPAKSCRSVANRYGLRFHP